MRRKRSPKKLRTKPARPDLVAKSFVSVHSVPVIRVMGIIYFFFGWMVFWRTKRSKLSFTTKPVVALSAGRKSGYTEHFVSLFQLLYLFLPTPTKPSDPGPRSIDTLFFNYIFQTGDCIPIYVFFSKQTLQKNLDLMFAFHKRGAYESSHRGKQSGFSSDHCRLIYLLGFRLRGGLISDEDLGPW